MAFHNIHDNSFVGFGGSDVGNRRERDINKHYDDVTGGNDVEFCGESVGEGFGGASLGGGSRSGVVRGNAAVIGLVEGWSNAYNTTKIATTDDNDNDNDDNNDTDAARRATFEPHGWRGPFRPSPECGAIQEACKGRKER